MADLRVSRRQSLSARIDRVPRWIRQLVVFACVGGVLNVVYGLLYVLLRDPWARSGATR